MPEKMTRVTALKTFFNRDTNRPVENGEMMTFWKSLTENEKQEFALSAATQLGVELKYDVV